MNVQEYIKSGILEEYVLGVVTDQERREVHCLSHIYPEIETELRALEASVTQYAGLFEKNPPRELKDKIFAQLTFAEESPTPVASETTPVRPLWAPFAAAAALICLVGAAWLFFQNRTLAEVNAQLVLEKSQLETTATQNASLLAYFRNPSYRIVRLKGTTPENGVTVFWNQQNNEVALYVDHLPTPAPGQQYQLWTIVDGQPVDMGVLDPAFGDKIWPMKVATGAVAAFAITLEKAGGSPTPNLEALYVMGNV